MKLLQIGIGIIIGFVVAITLVSLRSQYEAAKEPLWAFDPQDCPSGTIATDYLSRQWNGGVMGGGMTEATTWICEKWKDLGERERVRMFLRGLDHEAA